MGKKIPTTIKDQELVAQRRGEIIDVATRLFPRARLPQDVDPRHRARLSVQSRQPLHVCHLEGGHPLSGRAAADRREGPRHGEVEMSRTIRRNRFALRCKSYCRIVHEYRPHIRLLYRELDVLSPDRREIVMASLSTVTGVFEKIVRKGIDKGVFSRRRSEAVRAERALPLSSLVDARPRIALDHTEHQRVLRDAEQDHPAGHAYARARDWPAAARR